MKAETRTRLQQIRDEVGHRWFKDVPVDYSPKTDVYNGVWGTGRMEYFVSCHKTSPTSLDHPFRVHQYDNDLYDLKTVAQHIDDYQMAASIAQGLAMVNHHPRYIDR